MGSFKKLAEALRKPASVAEEPSRGYVEKLPEDVYREVAHQSGLPESEISAIGKLESQHDKYAKPLVGGSARGLFQFQPRTAEGLIPGSSESLLDRNTQQDLMLKSLEKLKPENSVEAYIHHNLGPGRAKKFLKASDDAPVTSVLPREVIKANSGLYGVKTIGEVKKIIEKKLKGE